MPHTKGILFFNLLADTVGREAFDVFLKRYFKDFAWGTITTDVFESCLADGLMRAHPQAFTAAEIAEWIHRPGDPAFGPTPAAAGYALADKTLALLASGALNAEDVETKGWRIQQQLRSIKGLPLATDPAKLSEPDAALGPSTTGNIRLAYEWLMFAARANCRPRSTPALKS